ncbi:MAG TPA: helix-turn-helix domain-containing protein [Chitinophaga sp.]|uniref:helix-turn-helix domain-containing protein n=1 Tax=Chitinophaga sp. TaxID=1869181 RepID=UPI002DBB9506|nr:helix-turn-helix domain-containing protein [Chitinophaga sp.]HEU4554367.1 helix-turn-helix domain-containing protein [Chitinophaga sp.]
MATQQVSAAPKFSTGDVKLSGFKVQEISAALKPSHAYGRRDFYKIVLVTGDLIIHYGDQTIEINDTFLFFANPNIPHAVVDRSMNRKGYACLFTEAFIAGREHAQILQNSPLFRSGGTPVVRVNSGQAAFLTGLYQKMMAVQRSDYHYKDELLRNCLALILHEALSMQPSQNVLTQKNAAMRITYLFMELLERQFPIESTGDPLRLRTAQDFAEALSVHVNYLNRSVKEATGKPTSVHIAERIAAEAKTLLQHTSWNIADIAYGLGFEYPTYFNNYFKRITGSTPLSFRKRKV